MRADYASCKTALAVDTQVFARVTPTDHIAREIGIVGKYA